MNKRNGLLAEVLTSAKLIENGFSVSQPLNPASRYDLLVDTGERILKVQVKCVASRRKSHHLKNAFRCKLYTMANRNKDTVNIRKMYDPKDVDMFVIYLKNLDMWYIIPHDDVSGKGEITLLPSSKNSMSPCLRVHSSYPSLPHISNSKFIKKLFSSIPYHSFNKSLIVFFLNKQL